MRFTSNDNVSRFVEYTPFNDKNGERKTQTSAHLDHTTQVVAKSAAGTMVVGSGGIILKDVHPAAQAATAAQAKLHSMKVVEWKSEIAASKAAHKAERKLHLLKQAEKAAFKLLVASFLPTKS